MNLRNEKKKNEKEKKQQIAQASATHFVWYALKKKPPVDQIREILSRWINDFYL